MSNAPAAMSNAPAAMSNAPAATARPPAVTMRTPPTANPTASGQPAPSTAQPAPQRPEMPETIPDTAAITPIAPSPPAGAPPPPPVSDKATTAATPTTSGIRLTFAPGQSDLSPESNSSIKQLTADAPSGDATTFNVLAYAPGKPDDPSTARRISLSRAMAVRSALVADGVPSARIFVRALGEQYGDGPPDRVDISVIGANSSADTANAK